MMLFDLNELEICNALLILENIEGTKAKMDYMTSLRGPDRQDDDEDGGYNAKVLLTAFIRGRGCGMLGIESFLEFFERHTFPLHGKAIVKYLEDNEHFRNHMFRGLEAMPLKGHADKIREQLINIDVVILKKDRLKELAEDKDYTIVWSVQKCLLNILDVLQEYSHRYVTCSDPLVYDTRDSSLKTICKRSQLDDKKEKKCVMYSYDLIDI